MPAARSPVTIEGASLDALKSLPAQDLDGLLAFGRPICFTMGSATILAEFNREGECLLVNLAHIDGGGEGVLILLWKHVRSYAVERQFRAIRWNVHALTCAVPNPRLQRFLRAIASLKQTIHGLEKSSFGIKIFDKQVQILSQSVGCRCLTFT